MLTLFTAPKPFEGDIARLQNNAIASWLALRPEVQIILVGDEAGIVQAAARFGVEHAPEVERNELGTPLVNSVFELAHSRSQHRTLGYLNADVILLQDFIAGVQATQARFERFLMIGRRWDVEVERELGRDEFDDDELGRELRKRAVPHPPHGSDYFVFRAGEFEHMPPFAMGRSGWDNWMIYAGRAARIPVVDASADVNVLHQNHDYAHLPGGRSHYRLPESKANVEMAGGQEVMFTLRDADWRLQDGSLRRAGWPSPDLVRWLEAGLIASFGPGKASRLVRLALHPLETVKYYIGRVRGRLGSGDGDGSAAEQAAGDQHGKIRHPKQEQSR